MRHLDNKLANKIILMNKSGISNVKIAKKLKINEKTVGRYLNAYNLKPARYNILEKITILHSQGLNNKQIGQELNLSREAVSRGLKKLNLRSNFLTNREKAHELMIKYNNEGLSLRQISDILGINCGIINTALRNMGYTPNIVKLKINRISETDAICSRCNEVKKISEFAFDRGRPLSYCKIHIGESRILRLNNNVDNYLAEKFTRLRQKTQRDNIPFTITREQFIKQYHDQNGLCFYTDVRMTYRISTIRGGTDRSTISVDKIIPELGYITGNVVFCTYRINICKNDLSLGEIRQWMPPWYERIMKFLDPDLIQ